MGGMSNEANGRGERGEIDFFRSDPGAPGIVILDGGLGALALHQPRVVAFVYGEDLPRSPTLPFGRWKKAS